MREIFRYNTLILFRDELLTSAEILKNLLEIDIIRYLEVAIDELFAAIDKAKNASKEQK